MHDVDLRPIRCGRCWAQPRARWVETYAARRHAAIAAARAGRGQVNGDGSRRLSASDVAAHEPTVTMWRWPCRCGADWQVRLADLQERLQREPMPVVLGVDLG